MKRIALLLVLPLWAFALAVPAVVPVQAPQKEEVKKLDPKAVQQFDPKSKGAGYVPPTPQQREKSYAMDRARNGGRVAMAARMLSAPEKFDCHQMGWVPPVRDQGSCGSCYGVATADQLTCAFIKAGYQKNDDSFEINFQFGLDRCGPDFGGCNGGWGAEVAEWMVANGFPAERYVDASGKTVNDYPAYSARPQSCREKTGAKRWKPSAWGYCSGSSSRPATVEEIKACLMQYGVVNIAFNANNAYANAGSNVVHITGQANHETTLVGWDDAKNGGKGAWKTRGNWGKGLGDGGYVWMTYNSQIVDPFWMSATPLPPPPDPPPPVDGKPPFKLFVGDFPAFKQVGLPAGYQSLAVAKGAAQGLANVDKTPVHVYDSVPKFIETVLPDIVPPPVPGQVTIQLDSVNAYRLTPAQVQSVLDQAGARVIGPNTTMREITEWLKAVQQK